MKKGSTRYVFFIGNYAFKIPSLHGYTQFLWGLLANMQEVKFSKISSIKDKLCPVVFYIPFGLMLVMPKVRVLNQNEISKSELESFCLDKNCIIPSEIKYDSFGYLGNKLVAIDFG